MQAYLAPVELPCVILPAEWNVARVQVVVAEHYSFISGLGN